MVECPSQTIANDGLVKESDNGTIPHVASDVLLTAAVEGNVNTHSTCIVELH